MEKTSSGIPARASGRDLNLDLIRALGAVLVVSVHFLMMIDFYYYPVQGWGYLLSTVARMAFMTCVPLFLLLTGYLCCEKQLTAGYYKGVFRVVLAYLLASGVSIFFRWWFQGEQMSLLHMGRLVLDYTGVATGWYIEMYLGLFLLIPFLNMLWRGAGERRPRQALIATLLLLTSLPALTNSRYQVLPDWWQGIYPLSYYFLGAYFRAYQPKWRLRRVLPAFLLSVAAGGVLSFAVNYGKPYVDAGLSGYAGPTVVLSACLLFDMLRRIPLEAAPGWLKWAIRKGAELSLLIYMVSWCFDTAFYPWLRERVPGMAERWPWFFVMVPAVYLASALVAQVLEWLRRAITAGLDRAFPRLGLK